MTRFANADERRLSALTSEMQAYNRAVAPGSECVAWGMYVDDCHTWLGVAPSDATDVIGRVPADFWDYWLAVARGDSADFDAATGDYLA